MRLIYFAQIVLQVFIRYNTQNSLLFQREMSFVYKIIGSEFTEVSHFT